MNNGLTVVLDTNVLLSGLAFPGSIPGKIVSAWRSGAIEVVLSEFILNELRRVLPRLSHRHGMTPDDINDLVDIMSFWVQCVDPVDMAPDEVRDPFDLAVLGTFLAAEQSLGASYLITGDKDLTTLADQYPIVTPAQFWQRHGGL